MATILNWDDQDLLERAYDERAAQRLRESARRSERLRREAERARNNERVLRAWKQKGVVK